MPAHPQQSYTQNKNKTNNKLNIPTRNKKNPQQITIRKFQRFSDGLKPKTLQSR